ncbi:MAG: SMC-Scp complex subunit ScpB [Patescibacteria group bacterium]
MTELMNQSELSKHIEALLFATGEPVQLARLAEILSVRIEEVQASLSLLSSHLNQGIILVHNGTQVSLATPPDTAETVAKLLGDPEDREVGQAGLEVLAILLYQGPTSRSTIDYIRGVNSTSSIKTLLLRGLIERVPESGGREMVYRPTIELMYHLGTQEPEQLPDFTVLRDKLAAFSNRQESVTPTSL